MMTARWLPPLVVLRGGGDLATGVAYRLHQAGFPVLITELPHPLTVRRAVAFAEAVPAGQITVEAVTARCVAGAAAVRACLTERCIPVVVDEGKLSLTEFAPAVVVDARIAKRKLDTRRTDAPLVIGLGPGFVAGEDCHAVVETNRGHHLGRVYWSGSAEADTGQPEAVQGYTHQRVLRAPCAGVLEGVLEIGALVSAGQAVAYVAGQPLVAPFAGVLRGLLRSGVAVPAGFKVGDLDPRGARENCFTISDKARAVGGGVLEAILADFSRR